MSKQFIYKAMGSLAYAIAKADGEIQEEEIQTIKKLTLQEFDLTEIDNAWITTMFSELKEKQISLEEAYQYALDTLEAHRFSFEFDEVMKKKCLKFIERTADSFDGITTNERQVLKKLKEDLNKF